MTLPDNTTLQELLASVAPGPWTHRLDESGIDPDNNTYIMADKDGTYLGVMYGDDAALAALAPELAAEVIRLREALETLAASMRGNAPERRAIGEGFAAYLEEQTAHIITRIIEGDTND